MKFRPDIDGLRAIGVSAVVIFHAFPTVLRGGFIGVDIFFVISGFLISSILYSSLERNDFSVSDFYFRRIRRIFPALLLVLLATLAVAHLILLPDELAHLGRHVVAGAGFLSNVLLGTESGYFDSAADEKPLLHLWSLGVEEQFYLVFPLLLMFAWRFCRSRIPLFLAAGAVASFVWAIYLVRLEPNLAFFLPFSRFWEMLAGAALAYAAHFHTARLDKMIGKRRNLISLAGFVLLTAGIVGMSRWLVFPGWWALVPTLGTAAIIAAGPAAIVNRTLLSHPIALFLGRISYPLYLWHWPVLVFLALHEMHAASVAARLGAVVLSGLLAWLTYRFIEMPARKITRQSIAFGGLGGAMVAMAFLGAAISQMGSLVPVDPAQAARQSYLSNFRGPNSVFDYLVAEGIDKKYRYDCDLSNVLILLKKSTTIELSPSCTEVKRERQIFLWGDSHAQQFNHGLTQSLGDSWDVLQVASSGCPAALVEEDAANYCVHSNWVALEKIRQLRPSIVLLAQRDRHSIEGLRRIADRLLKMGVQHVILMGPTPQWTTDLPRIVSQKHWEGAAVRETRYLHQPAFESDRKLKLAFAGQKSISYLSVIDTLCNQEGCLIKMGPDQLRDITAWDRDHLTPVTSEFVTNKIITPYIKTLALDIVPAGV